MYKLKAIFVSMWVILLLGCNSDKRLLEQVAEDEINKWALNDLQRYEIRRTEINQLSDTRALVNMAIGVLANDGQYHHEANLEIVKIGEEWVAKPFDVYPPFEITFLNDDQPDIAGNTCVELTTVRADDNVCVRIEYKGQMDWVIDDNWDLTAWGPSYSDPHSAHDLNTKPNLTFTPGSSIDIEANAITWKILNSMDDNPNNPWFTMAIWPISWDDGADVGDGSLMFGAYSPDIVIVNGSGD